MQFEITKEYIEKIQQLITEGKNETLQHLLEEVHYADVAELITELETDEAIYLIKLLENDVSSDVIAELDEDDRENILKGLSSKEIAEELDELDTDDAADIIGELSEKQKEEVIAHLDDVEHAKEIVELLRYDEDTAGGLMAKELVKVNENWNVLTCVKEMRAQAEEVTRVHSIYVVDDNDILKGRLSLKDLLTTSTRSPITDVFIKNVDSVNVHEAADEVAKIMQKYDLEAIPVVDEIGRLVGRITIDDIVDVIKEEAEKDYQMAAGISKDVEADDTILELTKARLPWLVLALFGGFVSVSILGGFSEAMDNYPVLFFFTPLIAAMAGNVGVQSSAIIVQGLANDSLRGSLFKRLIKEVLQSLLNGFVLAALLMSAGMFFLGFQFKVGLTVAISLISVIIIASIIGTFVPIILDKRGIDPALATGPFITTSNDIFGILIYFLIAKLILGF
ncbi:magnesium transporter [Lutibacter agarilyticus]|uniref:Magnesium transporter MgtE n=1 Tax=Lutibacter agarilyticus TaxID=1109740 RepID=A0A238VWA7_9FLAO|nr:magnesium transporter [Lutibacter agarilyticus]SNR37769.1 magnesium transporter [Lutibacter agarilyticus]